MPELSPIPDTSFEAQYKRILEIAECKTQVELADFLGIRQSSISDAKRRGSIPPDWLIKLFEKKQANPEWIRSGTDSKHVISASIEKGLPHVVKVIEVRPPEECSAQDLFNELVRRAMQGDKLREIQKQVADSWFPDAKTNGMSPL